MAGLGGVGLELIEFCPLGKDPERGRFSTKDDFILDPELPVILGIVFSS